MPPKDEPPESSFLPGGQKAQHVPVEAHAAAIVIQIHWRGFSRSRRLQTASAISSAAARPACLPGLPPLSAFVARQQPAKGPTCGNVALVAAKVAEGRDAHIRRCEDDHASMSSLSLESRPVAAAHGQRPRSASAGRAFARSSEASVHPAQPRGYFSLGGGASKLRSRQTERPAEQRSVIDASSDDSEDDVSRLEAEIAELDALKAMIQRLRPSETAHAYVDDLSRRSCQEPEQEPELEAASASFAASNPGAPKTVGPVETCRTTTYTYSYQPVPQKSVARPMPEAVPRCPHDQSLDIEMKLDFEDRGRIRERASGITRSHSYGASANRAVCLERFDRAVTRPAQCCPGAPQKALARPMSACARLAGSHSAAAAVLSRGRCLSAGRVRSGDAAAAKHFGAGAARPARPWSAAAPSRQHGGGPSGAAELLRGFGCRQQRPQSATFSAPRCNRPSSAIACRRQAVRSPYE
eukprot:TRINITY_DN33834_c0_g1_i2.p1 TRINITY_DN33834_c0_g1~~TRINITY_DN33834_c0_g1_i2.p1  ORF type:complete len:468 (-),score=35.72 TRINITY_DN33834_c0_g1_i2:684-2087(-)